MTYTAKQVIEAFNAYDKENKRGVLDFLGEWSVSNEHSFKDVPGLGKVEFVGDQHSDGQMFVLVFKIGEQFFGAQYQFSSWDCSDYSNYGIYEVRPQEFTEIRYVLK